MSTIPVRFREYKNFNFIGRINGMFPFIGKRKDLDMIEEMSNGCFYKLLLWIKIKDDHKYFFTYDFWEKKIDSKRKYIWKLKNSVKDQDKKRLKDILFEYNSYKYQCLPFLDPDFEDSKGVYQKYIYIFSDRKSEIIQLENEIYAENDKYYNIYARDDNENYNKRKLDDKRNYNNSGKKVVLLKLNSDDSIPNYYFCLSKIMLSKKRIMQIEDQFKSGSLPPRVVKIELLKKEKDYERSVKLKSEARKNFMDYVLMDESERNSLKSKENQDIKLNNTISNIPYINKDIGYLSGLNKEYSKNEYKDFKYKDILYNCSKKFYYNDRGGSCRNILFLTDYNEYPLKILSDNYNDNLDKYIKIYDPELIKDENEKKKIIKNLEIKKLNDIVMGFDKMGDWNDIINYSVFAKPNEFKNRLKYYSRKWDRDHEEYVNNKNINYTPKHHPYRKELSQKNKKNIIRGVHTPKNWTDYDQWRHDFMMKEYSCYKAYNEAAVHITSWMSSYQFQESMFDLIFYIDKYKEIRKDIEKKVSEKIFERLGESKYGIEYIERAINNTEKIMKDMDETTDIFKRWKKLINSGSASKKQEEELINMVYVKHKSKSWFSACFYTVRKGNKLFGYITKLTIPLLKDGVLKEKILMPFLYNKMFTDTLKYPTVITFNNDPKLKTMTSKVVWQKYYNTWKDGIKKLYGNDVRFDETKSDYVRVKKIESKEIISENVIKKLHVQDSLKMIDNGLKFFNLILAAKGVIDLYKNHKDEEIKILKLTGALIDVIGIFQNTMKITGIKQMIDLIVISLNITNSLKSGNPYVAMGYLIAGIGTLLTLLTLSISGPPGVIIGIIVTIATFGGSIYAKSETRSELQLWLNHSYFGKRFGGGYLDKPTNAKPPWAVKKFEDWNEDNFEVQFDSLNNILYEYGFRVQTLCQRIEFDNQVASHASAPFLACLRIELDTKKFFPDFSKFEISAYFEDDTGVLTEYLILDKIIKINNRFPEEEYIDTDVFKKTSGTQLVLLYYDGNAVNHVPPEFKNCEKKIKYDNLFDILRGKNIQRGKNKFKRLNISVRLDLTGDGKIMMPKQYSKRLEIEFSDFRSEHKQRIEESIFCQKIDNFIYNQK